MRRCRNWYTSTLEVRVPKGLGVQVPPCAPVIPYVFAPLNHMAVLFFIGVVEMVIVTLWTRVVVEARILVSGAVTFINILIWYYVITVIVEDINNTALAVAYAAGCALGTMLVTAFPADAKTRVHAWWKHFGGAPESDA